MGAAVQGQGDSGKRCAASVGFYKSISCGYHCYACDCDCVFKSCCDWDPGFYNNPPIPYTCGKCTID